LNRQGYRVVRISGFDVLRDGSQVCEMIREQIAKRMWDLGMSGH